MDPSAEVVEVHREPEAGHYRWVTRHGKGERLRLLALPELEMGVEEILG